MSRPETVLLLIRHAMTDAVGAQLAGRTHDVPLNQSGRAQAERLRERLATIELAAIYTSPMQRAIETAGPIARDRGLPAEPRRELTEIDFGEWSGLDFVALGADPRWRRFNALRSLAAVPNGERAVETQARIVGWLDELRSRHVNRTAVCVTHMDVIRLAVLFLIGAPIDFVHRLEIGPASITAVAWREHGPVLLCVNESDATTRHR